MFPRIAFILGWLRHLAASRSGLLIENLALRQQLAILTAKRPRPRMRAADRLFWVTLRRFWPRWKEALVVSRPDTVVRWHRAGLLLSFDGGGTLGGVGFDDEDVLEYDRVALWELAYDGSARFPSWIAADLDAVQATVNLGPGPPVVFGQTLQADANKVVFRWSSSVAFRAVRGAFASSTNIGNYSVSFTATGSGTSVSDPSTPAPGTGYWYLVRRGGCIQSSWQSSLGAEPGRDATLP